MSARGYEVGRNLQIEVRYTQGQVDRIPSLMAELVALHPDIIVVGGSENAVAVHAIAPTIPLVFVTVADPVALGLVPNLAHPGGNVTGIMTMVPEGFGAKLLQLLKTAAPDASRIAQFGQSENQLHKPDHWSLPMLRDRWVSNWSRFRRVKPKKWKRHFKRHVRGARRQSMSLVIRLRLPNVGKNSRPHPAVSMAIDLLVPQERRRR